ncbi:hypothetical protein [Streptomyces sp. NPDC094472]
MNAIAVALAGKAGIRLLRKRVILVVHSRRSPQRPADYGPWSINAHENLG